MLVEKSQEIISLSQKRIDLYRYAENFNGFQEREKQLTLAIQELTQLVVTLRVFRQKGAIAIDFNARVEPILGTVTSINGKFQDRPESIIDNNNFNGAKFLSTLKSSLTNPLKKELLEAWKNYLTRTLPATNPEIIDLLYRIDAFKPTVQKVKNLRALIKEEELPKSEEEFSYIESIIHQLQESWNALSSSEVPDDVIRFLRASVSQQGATLDLLNPEVLMWVKQNRVDNLLRIRLS